jgi:hypothetical protein
MPTARITRRPFDQVALPFCLVVLTSFLVLLMSVLASL